MLAAAFGGSLALAGAAAYAQQQEQQQEAQKQERIEVTGSSIKRIDAETALPVQILTREDIKKTGAANVEQLLQTVSAVSSSGGITASSVSGATTGGISAISLRGLGSIRTLVLLNGKRIAPYGIGFTGDSVSVDVNSIPISAIERVEVLKDGASAIYGSDAIAGVVNFILRKDFTGTELTASYGDSTQGGGAIKRLSATWGYGDLAKDRFNVMLSAGYQKEDPIYGRDRAFASSSTNLENQNDTTSGNTFPANIAAADGSFGSRNPTAPACPGPYAEFNSFRSTRACRFDPAPLVQLIPDAERTSLFAAGRIALTPNIEGYLEASYNRNKQNNIIQPVPISDQFGIPLNNPLANQAPYNQFGPGPVSAIVLTSSSPYYPTAYVQSITGGATPDLLVRYRAAVNGNRNITDTSEAPRLTFGVKGVVGEWDFDANFLHSQSKVTETVNDGYPILSKILPLLNSGNVNFFGPNTPGIVAQLRATNFTGRAYSISSTLDSVQGKASRELTMLPGGPLAVALGAELRKEKYNFDPSEEIASGDVSGYGGNFGAVDKSRNVQSVFAELNAPILKGLEATAAVRYDHYEGVGNSTTPKLSFRWQPAKEFLLRGSLSRGFRAPSLQDLYLPQQNNVTPQGNSDPIRCPVTGDQVKDCGTQFLLINRGNPALKPEKSSGATLGIVFEPASDVSIAVDAFRITVNDIIVNGVPFAFILATPQSAQQYANLITRGPVDPAFPNLPGPIASIDQTNLNLGKARVSGIDFDTKFRIPAGEIGKFTISYSGTYFMKNDASNPDGTFANGIDQANTATGGLIPRLKTYLSVNWARGPWNATLAYSWQGGYGDAGNSPNFDLPQRQVGAYEIFDGQVQYAGIKDLELTLGIKNLFNRPPPYSNNGGQASFQSGYDPQYVDPRGRFIYLTATYRFK
jgi:iron complex outermembrane receptor protein